jgi:ribonuclease HI
MAKQAPSQGLGSTLGTTITGEKGHSLLCWAFTDSRRSNISEPLDGPRQTNQRAELTAILRAVQIAPKDQDLEIITDSSYSINCCTVWIKGWIKNAWKTSTGKDVENKDLVLYIKTLLNEREALGSETIFTWIKGHDNNPGNEAADRLAVAGAMAHRY